eukprot:CAMPEP_0173184464 /NCGR_PEP_ID=MMETSP1141-20130122/8988_1 /TAXON_ID=483371 /ORGANISM="non described non described, Strain CCMP2298" /LENGTH=82 /DNA_ID=CAMNT_0014107833 /DNA_START=333 /DNA_END=581 /DNA_ORIENTATION=+
MFCTACLSILRPSTLLIVALMYCLFSSDTRKAKGEPAFRRSTTSSRCSVGSTLPAVTSVPNVPDVPDSPPCAAEASATAEVL